MALILLSDPSRTPARLLGMTTLNLGPCPTPEERPTLTVAETGRLLGLSKVSTYEAVHRGEIPVIRIGRRMLVPTAALRRLLQADEQPVRASPAQGPKPSMHPARDVEGGGA